MVCLNMLVKKLKTAKSHFLGLSTKVKILVVACTLFFIIGISTAVAISSHNDKPKPPRTTEASESNEQGTASSTEPEDDTGDNQQDDADQQSGLNTTQHANSTSTKNTGFSGRSSSDASKPGNQSVASKPSYNLNDKWYFAAVFGAGPFNKCYPESFTEENEARCMGGEIGFTEVGVAKTEQAASDLADNKLAQKAANAHVELRRGAGVETGPLTETACSNYGLSCGRW